jgi:hypothetical protein
MGHSSAAATGSQHLDMTPQALSPLIERETGSAEMEGLQQTGDNDLQHLNPLKKGKKDQQHSQKRPAGDDDNAGKGDTMEAPPSKRQRKPQQKLPLRPPIQTRSAAL